MIHLKMVKRESQKISFSVYGPFHKQTRRDSDFLTTLKPVLLSLVLVGTQTPAIFAKKRSRSLPIKWWNAIALLYLHIYTVKAIAAVAMTSGGLGFWMQISTFVRSAAAAISADIYICKRNKLHRFIRAMDPLFEKLPSSDRRKFRRRVKVASALLWLFVAFNAAMMIAHVLHLGMERFLDVHFFSARLGGLIPPTSQYVLGSALLVVRQSVMWGTLSFTVMLYAALCDAMRSTFKAVNRDIVRTFGDTKSGGCVDVQRRHAVAVALLSRMDDVFCPIVFFWTAAFVLSLCIDITFDIAMFDSMDTLSFLTSLQKVLLLLAAYMVVGLSASLAVEEAQRALPMFLGATAEDDVTRFFAVRLASTRPTLTGWRFFELSRGYMLTLFGILGSYVVIVFQLNPHAMAVLINGSS